MKATKRIISIILLLTLLVGMVPTTVQAEEMQTTVENGGTTIEGTNSFGTLLSEDIQEQQAAEEENYSGGYNVIGLTIENGVATVQYDTLEEAVLVVSLYTEDGLQLLVSGNAIVQPEGTEAVITLEGEIPEYFMASAYLLDTYDYSPLCESYDTPMYTKEMQELLASTTDDYDADKVLNLDDDKTTNFAVYADTTIVLEYIEGVNTVVSADDETATYVIENADNNITKLETDDILAYAYGENQILIVKVSSIKIDGTTVTISGADLEMEEVFSHVKLETMGDASDVTVDESTAEEGVIYDGLSSEGPQTYSLRAVEGESGWKHYLNFKLVDKKLKDETENLDVSVSISGSLGISIDVKFSYYVSTDRQFIEFKADAGVKATLSISGKIKSKLPLPEFKLTAYGVSIGFEPKLQLEFSGKVEYSFFAGFTIGISYENGKGIHDLSTAPKVESEFKLEGSVFFGIDLTPTIEVLKGAIVEAKLEAPIGFELKALLKGTMIEGSDPDADSVHTCEKCVEMELNFKAEFSAKLKFLKCKWLSLETKAKAVEVKIGDMYWSVDREEFAWGKCPHISYRVTVYVQDSNDQNAVGTEVVAGWVEKLTEIPLGRTNSNGVVVYYLQEGTYTFMATVDGESLSKEVAVEEACKVTLDKGSIGGTPTFISGYIDPEYVTDNGVVASGTAGYNIVWTLYGSGLLEIHGSGAMSSWHDSKWTKYSNYITNVIIEDGITSIGSCAFAGCQNLYSIQIPDSVTSIGQQAFQGCDKLAEITLPKNLTHIGSSAFSGCGGLTKITIPKSVAKIEFGAFSGCEGLEAIWVDENNDFYSNDSSGALIEKETATLLQLPCGYSGIYHVPDGVKSIGASAFLGCDKLLGINISDTVTTIGSYAFSQCDLLAFVVISESVETINNAAFYYNLDNLEVIVFEGDAPNCTDSILDNVLYATIYYPSENITWTSSVMRSMESPYGSPVKWVAYEPDTNIESLLPDVPSVINNVAPFSAWGGEYETEVTDTYVLKKASFSGLVPDESYVLLALVSIEVDEILAPDNLLYIDQEVATEDGTLVFTYVQRETTDISYVMACGASHNDIKDAVVTFPEMNAGMETQTVDPIVVYDGNTLVEGVDYVVVGTVDYTAAGEYTCYIRGIYNYTGIVECTYTVNAENPEVTFGEKVYHNLRLQDLTKIGYAFTITTEEVVDVYGVLIWTGNADADVTVNTEGVQNKVLTYDGSYYAAQTDGKEEVYYAKPYVIIGDTYFYGPVDVYSAPTFKQDTETVTVQLRSDTDAVTTEQNMVIDLNGFNVTSVTANTGTLTVMDSKTDDYSVADGEYGEITTVNGSIVPETGYVAVAGENGVSYHKVSVKITDMVLRPSAAGVYYKCIFEGDEIVAAQVTSCGVALSVYGIPSIEDAHTEYTVFTEFESGAKIPGSLLKNVMQEGNTATQNDRNANMLVYGRAYIQIGNNYIYSDLVQRSFRRQVELADTMWSELTTVQKDAVLAMYDTFCEEMETWEIPNIKEYSNVA